MLAPLDPQPETPQPAPMPMTVPIIERAFQIARTGGHAKLREIAAQLESEGYVDVQEHLADCPLLRRQLRTAARKALRSA